MIRRLHALLRSIYLGWQSRKNLLLFTKTITLSIRSPCELIRSLPIWRDLDIAIRFSVVDNVVYTFPDVIWLHSGDFLFEPWILLSSRISHNFAYLQVSILSQVHFSSFLHLTKIRHLRLEPPTSTLLGDSLNHQTTWPAEKVRFEYNRMRKAGAIKSQVSNKKINGECRSLEEYPTSQQA